MTKLMAFDLDGTILFNRAVEPATEQAIARWQAEGNLAVSCTGKSIFATQLALNPTAIRFDYHVLYTGAVITDRQYRVIYHQPLPVSVVQACYEHFSTVDGVALFATTLDNDYSLCDRVGSSTNILPEFTPLPADDLQNHEYVGVPLWIPDAQVREAAYTWILERFGNSVDCHKNQAGAMVDVTVQSVLNDLLPGLASLGLCFLCMWLLKKKINAIWLIFALFGVGILGSYLGFLAL